MRSVIFGRVIAVSAQVCFAAGGCGACNGEGPGSEQVMSSNAVPNEAQGRERVSLAWRNLMPCASIDGDHTRAGRARSARRVPTTLQPVRALERAAQEPPQHVVVALSGMEVLVDGQFYRAVPPFERSPWKNGGGASFPDGWTDNGRDMGPVSFSKEHAGTARRFAPSYSKGRDTLVARGLQHVIYVGHREAFAGYAHDPEPGGLPAAVNVEIVAFWMTEEHAWDERTVARHELDGEDGAGAIGYDARIALFTHGGRFLVVSFEDSDSGKVAVDVNVGVHPKSLSITSAGYALLSGERGAGNYLQLLDDKGAVKWALAVGFDAEQPAIDGGGGRLYLVGGGFAAVEDGKALWSSASSERVSAMAFSDGGLAMTVGTELRVLDRDGYMLARLSAPEGEILGRPAIGPDGAIWVASKTTLYVAR